MLMILSVLVGAVMGCCVCAFGIWAFLKGQSAAIVVSRGGLPDNISVRQKKQTGGVAAPSTAAPSLAAPSLAAPSLAEQFGAMFRTEGGE